KAQLAERGRRILREGLLRVGAGAETVARRRERLDLLLPAQFQLRRRRLERAAADLARLSPGQQLARRGAELGERGRRLEAGAQRLLAGALRELDNRAGRLVALSPAAVL